MVMKNRKHVGTTLGLVGAVVLGVATIVNTNCVRERDYVDKGAVVSHGEYSEEYTVDRLAEALGDRLEDKSALYDLNIEDRKAFTRIYEGNRAVEIVFPYEENRKNYRDNADNFNPFKSEKAKEYDRKLKGIHLIPKDGEGKEADKLAFLYYYLNFTDDWMPSSLMY